jgi:hypothetical protein
MSATTRERLERTARIVAGGTCPHGKCVGPEDYFCEKPVEPTTGTHADGTYHHTGAGHVWNDYDDTGAFIE